MSLLINSVPVFSQNSVIEIDSIRPDNLILNDSSLIPFFEKLKSAKQKQVTILQMGDSHMQMGYFTEEIRTQFGAAFGLSGIGNIFPYPIAKYRPFYIKTNIKKGNWQGSNYLNKETDVKYGVSGFTIKTNDADAVIDIMAQRYPKEISTGKDVVIYFSADESTLVEVSGCNSLVDSNQFNAPLQSNINQAGSGFKWKKASFSFEKPINKIRLRVKQTTTGIPFYLYDIQLLQLDRPGITYHNFGVGGAQFSNLCENASLSVEQMNDLNPGLIIFSYGSNESYTTSFKYNSFYNMVLSYVEKVKSALPDACIILTSPPDTRAKNLYPRNTDSITLAFKNIASQKNIAFWDLRKQMGGNGSLFQWLNAGLAANDKLHFASEGYKLQAKLFMEAFFKSYNHFVSQDLKITMPVLHWKYK